MLPALHGPQPHQYGRHAQAPSAVRTSEPPPSVGDAASPVVMSTPVIASPSDVASSRVRASPSDVASSPVRASPPRVASPPPLAPSAPASASLDRSSVV